MVMCGTAHIFSTLPALFDSRAEFIMGAFQNHFVTIVQESLAGSHD
jgi:hypothetical protein